MGPTSRGGGPMKRAILFALVVILACKTEHRAADRVATIAAPSVPASEAVPAPPANAPAAKAEERGALPSISQVPSRMVIRNASVSLVVHDAADSLRSISALVDAKAGYVAESRQWKERDQVRASATLRVPAMHLDSTLQSIRSLAVRVESETISGEDVSQEFTDLGSRLRNLQTAENELLDLLRTERTRARRASDILEIYDDITRVR